MQINLYSISLFVFAVLLQSCMTETEKTEIIVRNFINRKEKEINRYDRQQALAYWQATFSGDKDDYEKIAELTTTFFEKNNRNRKAFQIEKLSYLNDNVLIEQEDIEFVRKVRMSGMVEDTLLKRRLDLLYLRFVENQVNLEENEDLINQNYKLLHRLQNHLLEIDGTHYNKDEIDSIRRRSGDPKLYKRIYEEKRKFTAHNYKDILHLIRLRNRYAQSCGFPDFYEFSVAMQEQNSTHITELLQQLDSVTREEYLGAKRVTDMFIARRMGIDKSEIMPWHYVDERYVFMPPSYTQRMDRLLEEKDIVDVVSGFFQQTGLSIDDVMERSSINDPENRAQSNYFMPVDIKQDLRIIAHVDNNYQGLRVFMGLCAYASYYKNVNHQLPYLVVEPNGIVAESIATFFSNKILRFDWLNNQIGISSRDSLTYRIISKHAFQIEKLFRTRHFMTMALFEKELYANPEQDLAELWWSLNERILGVKRPPETHEYDWAVFDYFVEIPVMVQRYIFAELAAAQLQHKVDSELEKIREQHISVNENEFIGDFLRRNVYNYGNVFPWEELIVKATGEQLTPGYFYESIVNKN